MKRRTFFIKLFVASALGAFTQTAKAMTSMNEPKELLLDVPNFIVSESVVKMPANPKNGALVHVIVEGSSLKNPCKIVCNHSAITGEREPLVLDQLATIVFKYDAFKKDWIL